MNSSVRNADIPCKVFKTSVENHAQIKPLLLASIEKLGIHSAITKYERISNSDWHVKNNIGHDFENKEYLNIVSPILAHHNKQLAKCIGATEVNTNHIWFQQYGKGDFHGWHSHGNCMYSNVYYVELGSACPRTSFRFMGTEFSIDVEEGDILTFPSFLQHCSRPNRHDSRKTVIAFNSNSDGVVNEQILDSV
jgi:ectoine hydroxylase-related dioxygenase (phytanoyl-CoA dioxygenase family)